MSNKIKCKNNLHWHEISKRSIELCNNSAIADKYHAYVIETTLTSKEHGYNWYVHIKSGELIANGYEKDKAMAKKLAIKAMI